MNFRFQQSSHANLALMVNYDMACMADDINCSLTRIIHQQFPEARKSQHSSGIPTCLFVNGHGERFLLMHLCPARLFVILHPIDGGALPSNNPKWQGIMPRFDSRCAGDVKGDSWGTKWASRGPADIGRIGRLGRSGNCCLSR